MPFKVALAKRLQDVARYEEGIRASGPGVEQAAKPLRRELATLLEGADASVDTKSVANAAGVLKSTAGWNSR